jgi:hypothetical protein
MRVCLFCAGRRTTRETDTDAADMVARYSFLADQGRELRRFYFGQYSTGPTTFAATQLIVPKAGRSQRITHIAVKTSMDGSRQTAAARPRTSAPLTPMPRRSPQRA